MTPVPSDPTVAMFSGYDWAASLQSPLDVGKKGEFFFLNRVFNCAGEEKGVAKTENRPQQSCNSLSGSELKRRESMESFYSSSVLSTTFTSFPRHPDDSSLWPRVTQVLQMSRKEEREW